MPESSQLDNIKIEEYVIVNDNRFLPFHPPSDWIQVKIADKSGFQLPERKATIRNHGLLLKEVIVSLPLDCIASYGSKASVELNDFPINSFYAAHNAQGLQKFPYLDTETVTWNSDNLEIKFSYIPPPFQILRPLLKPLIGVSTASQWFMGIIGFIGTIVFIPIIKPVLIDAMQKILKNRMEKTEKLSKPMAKLIVSDKGDEKEIEIKKGKK